MTKILFFNYIYGLIENIHTNIYKEYKLIIKKNYIFFFKSFSALVINLVNKSGFL